MKEALNKVRADLGPEAVILDARQCKARGLARILAVFGIGQRPMFEVLAAIDGDSEAWGRGFSTVLESAREARGTTTEPAFGPEPGVSGTSLQSEGNGYRVAEEQDMRPQVATEENGQEAVAYSRVDATLNLIARESAVRARVHSLPAEMVAVYQFLVDEDVSEKTAFRLANAVASKYECAPDGSDAVLEWAFDEVANLVGVSGPIEVVRGRRKVVGLIGPTGVGKTTTIAKIAAGFALVEKARTALITADTYRIAAIEQIKTYAEIIGVPWEVVYSPRDMETALAKHSDAELVLIDTAGRSPNSPTRMYELRSMMDAALPEEIHLVLSATTRRQDLDHLVDRFAQVGFDKVILTKLDESSTLGAIFNIHARSGRPFSYFANGQSVPEDILAPTCTGISDMMISNWRTGGRV
ncbi:MAG: flagellar biosynthesis protein FlhF [Firmicutes bacterium]|nr:flagellar biosynthesis protein FlhF [Bacillota bacterium]